MTDPYAGGRSVRVFGLMTALLLVLTACGNRHDETTLRQAVPGARESSALSQPGEADQMPAEQTESQDASAQNAEPDAAGSQPADPGAAAVTGGSQSLSRSGSGSNSPAPKSQGSAASSKARASKSEARSGSPRGGDTAAASPGKAAVPQPGVPAPQPGTPATGSKEPLRVGVNGSMSGVLGTIFGPGHKAVQAWAARVNAEGGLNGHPVSVVMADDGSDPARNRANSQRMVEQDKVVAFVYDSGPVSSHGSVSYIQEKRVPVIGSAACYSWVTTNSMYFPQISSGVLCAEAAGRGLARVAVPQNKKKVALVVCAEVSGCEDMARESAYKNAGLDPVYTAKVSLAQPDYTAQCLGAKNAGAEVLHITTDGSSIARMADNCASVGYRPLIQFMSHMSADYHLKRPSLDGHVVVYLTEPYVTNSPGIRAMKDTLAKYAPGGALNGSSVMGWTSALLLERVARNIGPGAPTSQGILDGLWSLKDEELGGGIAPPITFDKGSPNNGLTMKLCYWVVRGENGKFATDGQRYCEPWDTKLLG